MKKQLSLNQGPISPISQASTSFLMNPLSTTWLIWSSGKVWLQASQLFLWKSVKEFQTLQMVQKSWIFLFLCAGGSKASFDFFSGNLCVVSLRHMKVLSARRSTKKFIDFDCNDIVTWLCDHMVEIRKQRSDPDSRVAFTAGFGGTVLVKT